MLDVEILDLLQDSEARRYSAGPQQQLANSNQISADRADLADPPGNRQLGDWNDPPGR
jgi:hypothetical protein